MRAEFCDRCGKFIDADMRTAMDQAESKFVVRMYSKSIAENLIFCPDCNEQLQAAISNFITDIMPYALHTSPADISRSEEAYYASRYKGLLA